MSFMASPGWVTGALFIAAALYICASDFSHFQTVQHSTAVTSPGLHRWTMAIPKPMIYQRVASPTGDVLHSHRPKVPPDPQKLVAWVENPTHVRNILNAPLVALLSLSVFCVSVVVGKHLRIAMAANIGERSPAQKTPERVVVVTGCNKGIGFHIARRLGQQGWHVVMACRSAERMQAAMDQLRSEGLQVSGVLFDLQNESTIKEAARQIQQQYGSIDALVNNAGMAYKFAATEPFGVQAHVTVGANFYGTLYACQAFLPLMKPGGRVVNVSSRSGQLGALSRDLQSKLTSPKLTTEELCGLMDEFVKAAEMGIHKQKGWSTTAYGVSKTGVTVMTQILARENPSLRILACCPGWCRTDMAGSSAPNDAAMGADTPVWLLTEGLEVANGGFYAERRQIK